jgi:hypothetical protein
VSFPIEKFRYAVTPRSFCVLVFGFHRIWCDERYGSCNVLFYMVNTSLHSRNTKLKRV